MHGGAFIGGTKDEIDYYFRSIAARGFCVVGIRYSLAPESTYPTPLRQAMAAVQHVQTHADRLHADTTWILLAGDSAGSHISAQVAAAVANPDFAREVRVPATISIGQLRGVVLCCGIYDFATAATDPAMKDFMTACGWAYSGTKDFLNSDYFISTTAVADHITTNFPPAFLTVGNVDPLPTQTEGLLAALQNHQVPVETLFYEPTHQPPLSHEYQFDLSLADGRWPWTGSPRSSSATASSTTAGQGPTHDERPSSRRPSGSSRPHRTSCWGDRVCALGRRQDIERPGAGPTTPSS